MRPRWILGFVFVLGMCIGARAQEPATPTADVRKWRDAVMARLLKFKPHINGANGTALIRFTLGPGGEVVLTTLLRSTGRAELDDAAIAMIQKASPLPKPPAGMKAPVNLQVPVTYR